MAENLRAGYQDRVALESLHKGNKVSALQKKFGGPGGAPVFLRGKHDVKLYRSVMVLSLVGIGFAGFCIYQMATGKMQKKT